MNIPALVLMARAPQAGRVKTRLQPALTPEQCADLYEAFLGDAIDLVISMKEYSSFLAFTPPECAPLFRRMIPDGMTLIPQIGTDLGQIIGTLISTLMERNYSPVVVIGSDIPTLQPGILCHALRALGRVDVCIGPSVDGGYYLIGANTPISAVFHDVPWGTPCALKMTEENIQSAGLTTALLEELSDVDYARDLAVLEAQIGELHNKPDSRIPFRTETWLKAAGLITTV
jgi:rSAM/selenodomain-associated transferase 1